MLGLCAFGLHTGPRRTWWVSVPETDGPNHQERGWVETRCGTCGTLLSA